MSFKLKLTRRERVAARFLSQVHGVLSNAFVQAKKEDHLTQRAISTALEVDKAVISRIFSGGGNPTARTIAELADAMGYKPELVLHKISVNVGENNLPKQANLKGVDNSIGYQMIHRNASYVDQQVFVRPQNSRSLEVRR